MPELWPMGIKKLPEQYYGMYRRVARIWVMVAKQSDGHNKTIGGNSRPIRVGANRKLHYDDLVWYTCSCYNYLYKQRGVTHTSDAPQSLRYDGTENQLAR